MVDKKLSEFSSVQASDVSDLVVLYLDGNNTTKNGKLNFSAFVSTLALLAGSNTFTGTNTFSGDVVFEETATFNKGINGVASRATADASGNNIENTYATKTELNGKVDLNLDNINPSANAKSYFAGIGMPSDYYEDLSFVSTAVGSYTYTATHNGYISVGFVNSTTGSNVVLTINNVNVDKNSSQGHNGSLNWACKKGDIIKVTVEGGSIYSLSWQRFFYSQGEV